MEATSELMPEKGSKRRRIGLIILILIVAGLSYLIWQRVAPEPTPKITPVAVEVTPVQYQNVPIAVNAIGSLIAPNSTNLKAQQAGVVKKIYFKNGQNVKEDQLLVELDPTQYQDLYENAKAAMLVQKSTYDRYIALQQEDPEVLSKLQIDQALGAYQQALATMDAAKEKVDNMSIRAPFAGTASSTNLAEGSYVNQGDSIITIVDRNTLEVSYSLPENYYGQVKVGQTVTFTSDAYPAKTFNAIVDYVSPLVSEQNRAFSIRALYNNKTQLLSPGMLVNLSQLLNANNKVLAVPAISLVTDMTGYAVYTIQNGKVLQVPVQIGSRFGSWVEVISGLKEGDQVISAGQEKVQPGSSVTISSGNN